MYNNKAIRRVVRAGRRSTIGNRVTGYNLFEGSNPLLSAKNEKAVPQGMAFSFFICKGFEQGGSRLCLRKKTILRTVFADAVKEHRDAKAYGSMPKKSLALHTNILQNIALKYTLLVDPFSKINQKMNSAYYNRCKLLFCV